jgi:hypothetical protein
MKRLFSCSAALFILLCTTVLLARPGILKTKSGETYDGEIKDDGDSYTVTVDKVDSQIPKSDVASVSYSESIDQEFSQRMAALGPKDAEGRVKLARFAFDNGRNDLAIQALSVAMQIDPENADAASMLKTVQAQQGMEQNRASAAANPASAAAQNPNPTGTGPQTAAPVRLLTPADINSIRQHELKPDEDIPIQISTDLRRKFAAHVGMPLADFNSMSPMQQLSMIMDKGDADMRAAAKVTRDPQAIMDFKREIQPMVLRNCATSACHGGEGGGDFILYSGNDQATTYTNFYIMEQFSMKSATAGGFFDSGQRKLIQRGDGAHSLLIEFSLPAGEAENSHPKIPNNSFNGIFRSRAERLAQQAIQWMDHGLNQIEPNYGIDYTPPTFQGTATSEPSTLP